MIIETFATGPLETNTFIVADKEGGEAIVIEAEPVRMRRRFGSLKGVVKIDGEEIGHGVMRFAMEVPDEPAPSGV